MSSREAVLITGANTGIGLEIVKALSASDKAYDIIVAGRSLEKVHDAINAVKNEFPESASQLSAVQVDIEEDDSIKKAFGEVQAKFGRLDALINNAGGQFDQQLATRDMTEREMWKKSWDVNVTGSQVMTSTFVPLLLQSTNPRLIFLASGTSSFTISEKNKGLAVNQHPPRGWPKPNFDGEVFNIPAYRSAKSGLNMLMREWHRTLHEDGVKVWAVSPGLLATGLGGDTDALKKIGAADPSVARALFRGVLEGERDGDVGKVITREGIQPW